MSNCVESRDTATATSPAQSPTAEDGYSDIPGFCKSAPIEEIRKHGHVLTPGRYVGAAPQEDDGEPFEKKWPASPPNGAGSKPKRGGLTQPSRKTWRGWGLERSSARKA